MPEQIIIPASVFNDDLLSLDAVRIYVLLAEGISDLDEIAKRINRSPKAVSRRLRELMLAKHVEEVRDQAGGRRTSSFRLPAMESKMSAA